ncbi:ABC transporter substrate-binding protein [Aldersonia kunmingensis]|uniref:ABC transporter substrate-binding protein n=1 Tax=Aldersonia kunmingensis TaxID=408066 RepID=UPI000A009238|nr:ABC transporter substrate-binding protein [Aldersonia kunmingensis]
MQPGKTFRRGLRSVAIAAVASGLALTAVGCSSDDSDEASGAQATVVIEHTLGSTEIDKTPERVVALGDQWLDAAESLGIEPVGYAAAASVLTGGAPIPWEPESLAKATVINPAGDIIEQVAALNPDLILVPNFLVDKPKYEKLSQIAPTVGSLTPAQVDPWDKQVQTLGRILDKESEAEKVVADVNGQIEAFAQANPGLRGKTFLTSMLASPTQLMVLADPNDGSSKIFQQLGMVIPPKMVAEAGAQGRIGLSPERVGELNSDFLVTSAMPGMDGAYQKLPGYDTLPAVQKGAVSNLDIIAVTGLNTPTPLSVPYVLNLMQPGLAKAAA